jgi:hypothetical protein
LIFVVTASLGQGFSVTREALAVTGPRFSVHWL